MARSHKLSARGKMLSSLCCAILVPAVFMAVQRAAISRRRPSTPHAQNIRLSFHRANGRPIPINLSDNTDTSIMVRQYEGLHSRNLHSQQTLLADANNITLTLAADEIVSTSSDDYVVVKLDDMSKAYYTKLSSPLLDTTWPSRLTLDGSQPKDGSTPGSDAETVEQQFKLQHESTTGIPPNRIVVKVYNRKNYDMNGDAKPEFIFKYINDASAAPIEAKSIRFKPVKYRYPSHNKTIKCILTLNRKVRPGATIDYYVNVEDDTYIKPTATHHWPFSVTFHDGEQRASFDVDVSPNPGTTIRCYTYQVNGGDPNQPEAVGTGIID